MFFEGFNREKDMNYMNTAKKRTSALAGFLCAVLLFSASMTPARAAYADDSYLDVPTSAWYYDAVYRVTTGGFMTGISGHQFGPGVYLTRAMFVTILGNLCKVDVSSYSGGSLFKDVPAGTWYTAYVNWAARNGIAGGVSSTKFAPEENITREQLAVMILSFLEHYGYATPMPSGKLPFSDVSSISPWAKNAVDAVRQMGLMLGDDRGRFNPQNGASRAETAVILCNLIDTLKIKETVKRSFFPKLSYIVHAGGEINGRVGTNSKEAVENAYAAGCRVIELDMNFTSDGKVACIHHWSSEFSSGLTNSAPTLKKFLNVKIYDRYTPMDMDAVAKFMRTHPTVILVTDVKDRNVDALTLIAKDYPDLISRIVAQIYDYSEYAPVVKLGYQHIILTLYKMSWDDKINTQRLASFAKNNKLTGLTFGESLCSRSNYIKELLGGGVPLYTHTVNDKNLQRTYLSWGLTGIYTDNMQ